LAYSFFTQISKMGMEKKIKRKEMEGGAVIIFII
jgi:hypothetical protein